MITPDFARARAFAEELADTPRVGGEIVNLARSYIDALKAIGTALDRLETRAPVAAETVLRGIVEKVGPA